MLSKIKEFVKKYQADIVLVVGVILISLLSFAVGFIAAKSYDKEPLQFEENSYHWRGNNGAVSGLEVS